MVLRLLLVSLVVRSASAVHNCPMTGLRNVIVRATQQSDNVITQMQMVRKILEDVYGGTWGVLIIKRPTLVSKDVHWTIPDHTNIDGSPAFCLTIVNKMQYNVFKTGSRDSADRASIDEFVNRIRQSDSKQRPSRMTIEEFDQRLANAIEMSRQAASFA